MDHQPQREPGGRRVCRRCHRPAVSCICRHLAGLTRVRNRTGIFILQHPRERFHPLGTARIALLGLERVRLEQAGGRQGLTRRLALPPGTALLYPHPRSRPLEQVPPDRRPQHLLLLDATWANARKLYQANRWLERLPHFALHPRAPGRYRIRGEPHRHGRATIEAIIGALQLLEPETEGLGRLLQVFDAMIETQLRLARQRDGGPRRRLRRRPPRQVPAELLERPERLVVAYCESAPAGPAGRRLVQLAAVCPESGAVFERLLRPGSAPLEARHLAHMDLCPQDLERGVEAGRLSQNWADFLPPDPLVAAWSPGTLRLLPPAADGAGPATVLLKAAYCNLRGGVCGHLWQVIQREGLRPRPAPVSGRAALRLGQALAVLEWLRSHAAGGHGAQPC